MNFLVEDSSLSRSEQRRLGLLPRQILVRLIRMKRSGELPDGLTKRQVAMAIAMDTASDDGYATAWGAAEFDLDKILDFIEKVLELIIRFLPLIITIV